MESKSYNIATQLRAFTASLYAQIKLSTRGGYTDLSKSQEVSLLPFINLAFDMDFIDLNNIHKNFPGVDYGSVSKKTGLQMTATVTKQKFENTLKKYNTHDVLKNYPDVWFFLLTVEPVSPSVKVTSPNVEYFTLYDMVTNVLKKDIEFQIEFISLLKAEYPNYFVSESDDNTSLCLPTIIPVPKDMILFNDFISTKEWFPENIDEGYLKVYNLICSFQSNLRNCGFKARELLVAVIKLARPPQCQSDKLVVYEDQVLGSLNVDGDNYSNFKYQCYFLELNDLIETVDDYIGYTINGDDVYFNIRKKYILNYCLLEPEINIFSALYLYYLQEYSVSEFECSILDCDFSKLSDSVINKWL
ncbi:TPA: SMEK domain-containing protein [Citrobacter braakii]|nr:SMEK domain-containing protein [Citrobacter braakii]